MLHCRQTQGLRAPMLSDASHCPRTVEAGKQGRITQEMQLCTSLVPKFLNTEIVCVAWSNNLESILSTIHSIVILSDEY